MTIFGLAAAYLVLFAAGFGITMLAFRGRPRVNLAEAAGFSWLLGTGVISLALWVGGFVLSGGHLRLAVGAIALLLLVAGCLSAKSGRTRFFFPHPKSLVEWFLTALLVVQCGIMCYAALSHPLGWDGLLNWEIKARYAFLNDGVMPPSYYSDATRQFTHPAYPLWVPLTELWLYLCMDEAHQFWIKLLFPSYYAAGAVLLAVFSARLTGQRWIGLAAAALLFFVPCLTNMPGGAHFGYVDVPLSTLYLAAIGSLLLYLQNNDLVAWRCFALSLALLPWAKKEGAVLWFIALLCAAGAIWRLRRSWSAMAWLLPGPIILLGWKIFCSAMSIVTTHEFAPVTIPTIGANFSRIGWILSTVLSELAQTSRWSVFWVLAAAAFLYLVCLDRNRQLMILLLAIVAPVGCYAGSFVFSGWPDWQHHVYASISRLLLHVMPVTWLVIALALRAPKNAASTTDCSNPALSTG
jgi:hypothetical protein